VGRVLHELVVLLDEVQVVLVAVDLLAHSPLELANHDNFIIFIETLPASNYYKISLLTVFLLQPPLPLLETTVSVLDL
jgi:hypothetical protein